MGKTVPEGLEYGPRPQASGRAQDRGHSFSQYGPTRPRPANNAFIFFSLENYFIRNICVVFLLKQFRTMRVRLTFRLSKPVYLRRDSVFADFRTEQ